MKGTFFSQAIKWEIELSGQEWIQNSLLLGKISLHNQNSEEFTISTPRVSLCYADIKKVHSKDKDAFKPEISFDLHEQKIKPNEKIEFKFEFPLKENTPISDKKKSYFIVYGDEVASSSLQINITPKPILIKIISLLETFHRFKLKEVKTSLDGAEFILIPPTSKDFAFLDQITFIPQFESEDLIFKFLMQVKKIDMTSPVTSFKKEKIAINKRLHLKEYSLGKDYLNQDNLLKVFEIVFTEAKVKNS